MCPVLARPHYLNFTQLTLVGKGISFKSTSAPCQTVIQHCHPVCLCRLPIIHRKRSTKNSTGMGKCSACNAMPKTCCGLLGNLSAS